MAGRVRELSRDAERGARARLVEAWAEGLDTRVLHCRELLHSWRPSHAQLCVDGGWERVLVCTRCKPLKRQVLDSEGCLVGSPRYEYAEGYLPDREDGLGRLDVEDRGRLRLAAIRRQQGAQD
ncbi:hypothetical protein AB0G85_37275 [Streptomyces sioyaensis]|uniref:hypothetical protein n=1 Tax=Streptomyces sioyaensis TaxID=67364 RepID=UPI0033D22F23